MSEIFTFSQAHFLKFPEMTYTDTLHNAMLQQKSKLSVRILYSKGKFLIQQI